MTLIAVNDGTSNHTGSTVVGPVAGTLTAGSNSFVMIEGVPVMVEDGIMEIPSHQFVVFPPQFHSHDFACDTLAQSFVMIEGNKINLLVDSYSGDATDIDNVGTNNFVEII